MVKITKFKVMPEISRFFSIVIYCLEWSAQATPAFLSSAIATVGSSTKRHTDSFMRPPLKLLHWIDRANLMLEENEPLTVSLSVNFSPGQRKPVKVDVKISFSVEKVKEYLDDEVDELQFTMFNDEGDGPKAGQIAQGGL